MSMTAYTYSVRRVTCGVTRTVSSSSPRERGETARTCTRTRNEKRTRPSGERESGSYSGTRQRNRIQFGPS